MFHRIDLIEIANHSGLPVNKASSGFFGHTGMEQQQARTRASMSSIQLR